MTKLLQAAKLLAGAANYIDTLGGDSRKYRQAIAQAGQSDLKLNCKSVQKRLATLWGYVKAEQSEQEPVAWMQARGDLYVADAPDKYHTIPLYTAPPQREIEYYIETNKALAKEIIDLKNREWVEPSDEQIAIATGCTKDKPLWVAVSAIARAVLKLAKELNT